MNRKLLATILSSMIAGGFLFGSALGRADDGRSLAGFWPAASDVGATTAARKPPVPPAPPAKRRKPPAPPKAPTPPAHAGGVSVSIHDGKVQIDGIKQLVDDNLRAATKALAAAKDLPPDVRAKLQKHLDKVRATLDKRLRHLDVSDLDQLGDELGKMGDEIGDEMDQFGDEMDKWGKDFGDKLGKDLAHQLGNLQLGPGIHIDLGDVTGLTSSDDDDDDDLADAIADLGDLSLKPTQRAAISKLRADSDKAVAAAKQALDRASKTLHEQLANPAASDAAIAHAIDAVSQQEAAIRKARILAWVNARRVLDDAQRKKIDAARQSR